jgi:SAM-dependent methyltransferase
MPFEELKQRHAAMWGSAPFERIAVTLAEMHQAIVDSVDGGPGKRWLDVGCGTGELAFVAAATGAEVVGTDLSPTLAETARRQATERDGDVTFEVADAEALPYEDASLRHRHVVGRRDLRAGSSRGRVPARAGLPTGRPACAHGVDVGRRGRRVLPDHRLVRAAAASGCRRGRVVG